MYKETKYVCSYSNLVALGEIPALTTCIDTFMNHEHITQRRSSLFMIGKATSKKGKLENIRVH